MDLATTTRETRTTTDLSEKLNGEGPPDEGAALFYSGTRINYARHRASVTVTGHGYRLRSPMPVTDAR